MDGFWLILGGVFGACWGSFIHVVYSRTPQMWDQFKSSAPMALWWSFPGSHCPRCQHALSWFENVPVLGWLALRGRCRHCGASIPARYFWWECAWAAFGSGLAWWAEWKGIAVFWVVLALLVVLEGVWRVLDKRKVLDVT